MTHEIIIVLCILTGAIVLFVTDKLRPDIVALLTMLALVITKTLTLTDALAGFANPAVITIAAIFLITAGLTNTGIAARIGEFLFKIAGKNEARLVAVTMTASATLSLVMNNIAAASVLIPGLRSISRRTEIRASKLMIPLSFGTLLGGMATIFTTINLLANDALRQAGLVPFSLVDFFRIGSIISIAGIVFMVMLGRKILPNYPGQETLKACRDPEELARIYRLPDLVFDARILQESPLDGKSIAESQLGRFFNVNIIGLHRGSRIMLVPEAGDLLHAGDRLIIKGDRKSLYTAQGQLGLKLETAGAGLNVYLADLNIGVVEVIISPYASIVGQSLREINFRHKFGLAVLAIMREGEPILSEVKNTPLRFGDTLLVQGPHARIKILDQERDFIVLEAPGYIGEIGRPDKAPWALTGLGFMLLAAGFGINHIAAAALLGALVMILSGALKMDEGYQAIEWKAVVMVGGMLSLGMALDKSGAADMISRNLLHVLSPMGHFSVLAGFFIISMLLAQILSGAATTVLLAPIALSTAAQLQVSPHPIMMILVLGASSGFLTPVSHPVNVFVMGPGGYKVGDYVRVGLCLTAIVFLLAMALVPLFWRL
jgi:di/tricarboxylate transporter